MAKKRKIVSFLSNLKHATAYSMDAAHAVGVKIVAVTVYKIVGHYPDEYANKHVALNGDDTMHIRYLLFQYHHEGVVNI